MYVYIKGRKEDEIYNRSNSYGNRIKRERERERGTTTTTTITIMMNKYYNNNNSDNEYEVMVTGIMKVLPVSRIFLYFS